MRHFNLVILLQSVIWMLCIGLFSWTAAQRHNLPDTKARVVATFNIQCANNRFPRKELNQALKQGRKSLKNEVPHPATDGKVAVAYDLDGDGRKEYFVMLKDTGIGDNIFWGVFASKPARFLGIVFAEHIYLRQRLKGWAALTASSHQSVSDSLYTTYAFRKGKYIKVSGSYETSANRNDEPKFAGATRSLCEHF